MGTWGSGVYDSDSALDFVDLIKDRLIKTIVYHLAGEALIGWSPKGYGAVVGAVDLLASLSEHSDSLPNIDKKRVRHWRKLYLKQFEASTEWDNFVTESGADARIERRKIIEATFSKLEALAGDKM